MPISETGISIRPRTPLRKSFARGFSLLELLVVLTIIGIFVGAAVLSIDTAGRDRDSEQEAIRLQSILQLIREEALLQSRDFGVLFTAGSYRFYMYDYGQLAWLAPADDPLLAAHTVTEPLQLDLFVEDRALILDDDDDPDLLEEPTPQVMILSTGEMTPFSAEIFRDLDAGRFILTGELDGSMEITSRGF